MSHWKGIVIYLDREAVEDTLCKSGSCASGSVVAFDSFTTEVLSLQACLSIYKTVMNEAADGAGSRTVNG